MGSRKLITTIKREVARFLKLPYIEEMQPFLIIIIIIVIGLSGGVALLGIRREERYAVLPQGDQYCSKFL